MLHIRILIHKQQEKNSRALLMISLTGMYAVQDVASGMVMQVL
jgi:hypothetical protein